LVDQKPPNIVIEKASAGGLSINILVPIKSLRRYFANIAKKLVREILLTYGIRNCRVVIREQGLSDDQLIDVLSGNRVYIPSVAVLCKIDLVNQGFVKVQSKIGSSFIPISADADMNISALREAIYKKLNFIRIYLKKRKETDFKEPLIMQYRSNVGNVCSKIHRSLLKDMPRYGARALNLVDRGQEWTTCSSTSTL
jgi:ribosome-interacting GTPase 1